MPCIEHTRIHSSQQDGILLLCLSHPPLNTLDHLLRQQLDQALQAAEQDTSVQAIVLHGDNGNFSAGADSREFGRPWQVPWVGDIAQRIAASRKPVVVALQALALGGGLELALAAHARVGTASVRLGLPEIKLGLIPGGGGTQRLPRLVGVEAAFPLMLEGRIIDAGTALAMGLLDHVCAPSALLESAVQYARQLNPGSTGAHGDLLDAGKLQTAGGQAPYLACPAPVAGLHASRPRTPAGNWPAV